MDVTHSRHNDNDIEISSYLSVLQRALTNWVLCHTFTKNTSLASGMNMTVLVTISNSSAFNVFLITSA